MATPSVSGTLGGSSGVWAQLQQQQAQRAVEQAEVKARSLQAQAQDARANADRAVEKARSLGVESVQADSDAQQVRRGVAALDSLNEVRSRFDDLRQQIGNVLHPENPTPAPAPAAMAATNTVATPKIGLLIDVSA